MSNRNIYQKYYLRAADVCSILNISIPSLYRWVRVGLFPKPIKYGPHCSGWEASTIDAWVEAKKSTSAPQISI